MHIVGQEQKWGGDSLNQVEYKSYGFLAAFVAGILLGTIATNLFGTQFTKQLGIYGNFFQSQLQLVKLDSFSLFLYILQHRIGIFAILSVLSFTPAGYAGLLTGGAYYGYCAAIVMASATLLYGFMGFPVFLAISMPQYLFYGGAVFVVAKHTFLVHKRSRNEIITCVGIIVGLCIIGAFAEAYINPRFLKLLIN